MWFYCILAFAYLVCQEVIFHKKKEERKKEEKKDRKKNSHWPRIRLNGTMYHITLPHD